MNRVLLFIVAIGSALLSAGCDAQAGADGSAQADSMSVAGPAPTEVPLPTFQIELIELAFETASAIPVEPHIKDRSKMQELVVMTCLELDQPARARTYAAHIENWRRGASDGSYAAYCAERGFDTEAEAYAERAAAVAEEASDWRRDTIRARIAETYLWLKQPKVASEYETGMTEHTVGTSHSVRAQVIDDELFSAQVDALDALMATNVFDKVRNGCDACVELFDRFYDDDERRELAAQRITDAWHVLPHRVRIELLRDLTDASLAHGDNAKALEFIDMTESVMGEVNWRAEDRVPILAHVARQRFEAGDVEGASATAEESLETFEAERESIVNIYRAEGLQPLAEAYHVMGDREAALKVYRMALDEGAANPNARPRAEDLCATLCSMAVRSFEPTTELRERIHDIRKGLDHPW